MIENIKKAVLSCYIIEAVRILILTLSAVLFTLGITPLIVGILGTMFTCIIGFIVCSAVFATTMRTNLKNISQDAYEQAFKNWPLADFRPASFAFSDDVDDTADIKQAKRYFKYLYLLILVQFLASGVFIIFYFLDQCS